MRPDLRTLAPVEVFEEVARLPGELNPMEERDLAKDLDALASPWGTLAQRVGLARTIVYPASDPPERLFHGTSPEAAAQILREGLALRSRQDVHLAVDPQIAREVGSRKAPAPTLLEVRAREARLHGVPFYRGNESVWLADRVPAEFIAPAT